MSIFQASPELLFRGTDYNRPRATVEWEKMQKQFPDFRFYGDSDKLTSVQGYLQTNYGGRYRVRIELDENYPYTVPRVTLPNTNIDPDCPHIYSKYELCVMRPEQWTSSLSIAFFIAKVAIWLNKYDQWLHESKRRWPGKDQHR